MEPTRDKRHKITMGSVMGLPQLPAGPGGGGLCVQWDWAPWRGVWETRPGLASLSACSHSIDVCLPPKGFLFFPF